MQQGGCEARAAGQATPRPRRRCASARRRALPSCHAAPQDEHPCALHHFDQIAARAAGKLVAVFLDYDGAQRRGGQGGRAGAPVGASGGQWGLALRGGGASHHALALPALPSWPRGAEFSACAAAADTRPCVCPFTAPRRRRVAPAQAR